MKKLTRPLLFLGALSVLITQSGCYGSFALTNKLYTWNDGVTGNKFLKSLIFIGLCIIPVYEFCAAADIVILNLIEFWTGSNPISMKEGEYEQQLVERNGVHYKMEATRNHFTITTLDGVKAGQVTSLVYTPENTTWNTEKDGKLVALVKMNINSDGTNSMVYIAPNGKEFKIALPGNEAELAALKKAIDMNVAVR